MKENMYSHKLRYDGYLELICKCLSDVMYTKLTCKKILYEEITYIYGKTLVIIV